MITRRRQGGKVVQLGSGSVQGPSFSALRTAESPPRGAAKSKPIQQGENRHVAWRFSAPYPPSTNNLYMTVRNRRVKTQEARDFADIIGDLASILRVRSGTPVPPYRLTIELWAPDRRRRDADNGVKCLQDALLKGTGRDDAEVVELRVMKRGVDRSHPRADVTLEHVAPAAPGGTGDG